MNVNPWEVVAMVANQKAVSLRAEAAAWRSEREIQRGAAAACVAWAGELEVLAERLDTFADTARATVERGKA